MAGGKKQSRRGYEPRHIRLYQTITGCDAWLAASGNAIKVYIALARYNDGENNGKIPYSERRASDDTGLNRKTCRKALKELDELGFIKPTAIGHFKMKQAPATMWRLTHLAAPGCKPANPTREFEKYKSDGNKARGQSLPKSGPNITHTLETPKKRGPNITPLLMETSHDQGVSSGPKDTPQLVLPKGPRKQSETGNSWKHNSGDTLDDLSGLRSNLIDTLQTSELGTQSRLAEEAGIPKGTLSKFANGSGLALHHQTALKLELTKIGKICATNKLERN